MVKFKENTPKGILTSMTFVLTIEFYYGQQLWACAIFGDSELRKGRGYLKTPTQEQARDHGVDLVSNSSSEESKWLQRQQANEQVYGIHI